MKIGIILDGSSLTNWQAEALVTLATKAKFIVYSCTTRAPTHYGARHALYYLLNLFTIRNRLTRRVALPSSLEIIARHSFAAHREGAWQSLPADVLERINRDAPDVLIKFGMGLLKIPTFERLTVPILSYHHGNPARFRGRPAAFYELLIGEPVVGQVVQILSNRLDSGRIVAFAETRSIAHSYRATLIEAYRHSHLLLGPAIRNAVAGGGYQPQTLGPIYRLPHNSQVLSFVVQRMRRLMSHIFYGLTREKRWRVATVEAPPSVSLASITERLAESEAWRVLKTLPGYRFLADPFVHPDGGLLVEAMNARSGQGEILWVSDDRAQRLSGAGGHFSYPSLFSWMGQSFVLPEVSDWSSPFVCRLEGKRVAESFELRVPQRPRLLDPTIFGYDNTIYLFGNIAEEGQSVLRLWFADAPDCDFLEHPASPIRISPVGSRMGGTPAIIGVKVIRIGQDLRRRYGDGVSFFRVKQLDRENYVEEAAGTFRFNDWRGPHTINFGPQGEIAFDFYDDAFSLLAGLRRYKMRRANPRTRN